MFPCEAWTMKVRGKCDFHDFDTSSVAPKAHRGTANIVLVFFNDKVSLASLSGSFWWKIGILIKKSEIAQLWRPVPSKRSQLKIFRERGSKERTFLVLEHPFGYFFGFRFGFAHPVPNPQKQPFLGCCDRYQTNRGCRISPVGCFGSPYGWREWLKHHGHPLQKCRRSSGFS